MTLSNETGLGEAIKQHCSEMISMLTEAQAVLANSGKRTLENINKASSGRFDDATIQAFSIEIAGTSPKGVPLLFGNPEETRRKAMEILRHSSKFSLDYIRIHGCFSLLLGSVIAFYREFPESAEPLFFDLLEMDRKTTCLCAWAVKIETDLPSIPSEMNRKKGTRIKTDEKKDSQWELIVNVIREGKGNIYSEGDSLHQVAKNIIEGIGNHQRANNIQVTTPDATTIKRYLSEKGGITTKNVGQVSRLFNLRDRC
jgi:hypothetical protein